MYKITCTNKNVFGEEKFNNDYRGFNKSPKETEEEAEARFNRLVKNVIKSFVVVMMMENGILKVLQQQMMMIEHFSL